MAFFEWKDEYSCGIDGIDDQHKVIINIMNELFEGIRIGHAEDAVRKVLTGLLDYSNYHFSLEEGMFERFGYPKAATHLAEHGHFLGKVEELMIADYTSTRGVPLETLHYLRSWFENHMMKTDLDYCRHYRMMECVEEVEDFVKG